MAKTKTKVKKEGKARGRKQTELPGMETPRIEQVEAAIADLDEANQKVSKANDLREERAARLLELMKKGNLKTYKSEDLGLRIDRVVTEQEKVKVSRLEPRHADSDGADAG